jgi:hypothetical protein
MMYQGHRSWMWISDHVQCSHQRMRDWQAVRKGNGGHGGRCSGRVPPPGLALSSAPVHLVRCLPEGESEVGHPPLVRMLNIDTIY